MHIEAMSTVVQQSLTVREDFEQQHEQTVREEIERFRASNDGIVAANDRVNALWTFFWPMVALLNQAGLFVAWGVAAWRVFDEALNRPAGDVAGLRELLRGPTVLDQEPDGESR